jgi:uncharacterized membrane protein
MEPDTTPTPEQVKAPSQVAVSVDATSANKKIVKPVHIDGLLYVLMAMTASIVAAMSTDEAAKLITVHSLFWTKTLAECIGAGAGALKMFRSTGYSDSTKP